MASIQRRVGLTSAVIADMKNLKMSGLTEPVQNLVQGLRIEELASGALSRKFMIIAVMFSFVPTLYSPFTTFSIAQHTMDPAKTFASLSYLLLLSNPLITFFQAVPSLM